MPRFTLGSAAIPISNLPPGSYLVHATNCLGTWGACIAAHLAAVFPAACAVYTAFCNDAKTTAGSRWPPRSLAGQCLIIPPQAADIAAGAPRVHVVCLFTSYGYGRANTATGKAGMDNMGAILAQTRDSLASFRHQLDDAGGQAGEITVYSPLFNSGAFRVPWERTAGLIEEAFEGWVGEWVVLTPPA